MDKRGWRGGRPGNLAWLISVHREEMLLFLETCLVRGGKKRMGKPISDGLCALHRFLFPHHRGYFCNRVWRMHLGDSFSSPRIHGLSETNTRYKPSADFHVGKSPIRMLYPGPHSWLCHCQGLLFFSLFRERCQLYDRNRLCRILRHDSAHPRSKALRPSQD